ncbi:prostaglandin reductase-3-like [Asterias amurensis]|uniref:prostaglandin reductase-3-like n=1 Tax=Asterias amurensis TaxID=7602 RepID=UPI003AB58E32
MSVSINNGSDSTALPSTFRKLVCTKLSKNFREAAVLKTVPMLKPGPRDIVIRNRFVGINSTDIHRTAGSYSMGVVTPPYDLGFEGVGEVVDLGKDVTHIKIGDSIAFMCLTAFGEYVMIDKVQAFPIASVKPEYVPLMVSGLTADLALRNAGRIKKGETVLVTAAAGGTGSLAVQFAKLAGCHVIGTCSSESKAEYLKSIGCDRPIIYTKENVGDVLRKEYPKKIDVVYECIGGEMFSTSFDCLAHLGRMVIIGFVSGYAEGTNAEGFNAATPHLSKQQTMILLTRSLSVSGFYLYSHNPDWNESFARQVKLFEEGSLQSNIDNGKNCEKGPFKGIEAIADAIEFLYTKKSQGKVVVEIQ